jgi:hypothetical protein
LFLDATVVEEQQGLTRQFHSAEKHSGNPIIIADRPWEGTSAITGPFDAETFDLSPAESANAPSLWASFEYHSQAQQGVQQALPRMLLHNTEHHA